MTLVRTITMALALVLAPALAMGQQKPAQDEFVPVDQLQPVEEIPATPLVAAAYGVAWAAVLVYLWSMWTRLNKVDRELAEVTRRLGARK